VGPIEVVGKSPSLRLCLKMLYSKYAKALNSSFEFNIGSRTATHVEFHHSNGRRTVGGFGVFCSSLRADVWYFYFNCQIFWSNPRAKAEP